MQIRQIAMTADRQDGNGGRTVGGTKRGAGVHRGVVAPRGLCRRTVRALQLDPRLYREVAASDGDAWQAAVVVLAAATASGMALGARMFHLVGGFEPALLFFDAPMAGFSVMTALSAVTHVVAWPLWAAGLWVVGPRLSRAGPRPGFRSVARVVGFAQAPGLGLFAIPILTVVFWFGRVDPDGVGEAPLGLLASSVWSLVGVWVLLGTFVAVREVLGLSNGRTLAALAVVGGGAAIGAVLLRLAVPGVPAVWSENRAALLGGPSGFDVASGMDFNLGLGLADAVMAYLVRLATHGWL